MIFVKLALFMLALNLTVAIVATAAVPLNCVAFGDCETFQGSGEGTWETEIEEEIEAGEYKSTQVESQIDTPLDYFNSILKVLSLIGTLVQGTISGGSYMTQFFLCGDNLCQSYPSSCVTDECGWSNMAVDLASKVQIFFYAVYILALIQLIRGYNVEK